ncbi:MAG: hypothetical protein WB661_01520 [Candidatus Bathyarchaeia archaeon]|jgi:hypothetical protein
MAENPPAPTATAPVDAAAPQAGTGVGNPRDIQGILALVFVGGTLGIAGVAIAIVPASALQVLAEVLPLTGTVIGYYFGVKSQQ